MPQIAKEKRNPRLLYLPFPQYSADYLAAIAREIVRGGLDVLIIETAMSGAVPGVSERSPDKWEEGDKALYEVFGTPEQMELVYPQLQWERRLCVKLMVEAGRRIPTFILPQGEHPTYPLRWNYEIFDAIHLEHAHSSIADLVIRDAITAFRTDPAQEFVIDFMREKYRFRGHNDTLG